MKGLIQMADKAEYRSALRSKKLIKESFIELLMEKPFDKITVTDIVNRANINRGTFYAHYSDINRLVHAIEEEIVDVLCNLLLELKYPSPMEDPLPLFLKISEYLEENKELIYALLHSNNTSSFIFQLPDLIARQLISSESLENDVGLDPLFLSRCRFYAGGAASLYAAWFQGTLGGSLTDVAYTLEKIVKEQNDKV